MSVLMENDFETGTDLCTVLRNDRPNSPSPIAPNVPLYTNRSSDPKFLSILLKLVSF